MRSKGLQDKLLIDFLRRFFVSLALSREYENMLMNIIIQMSHSEAFLISFFVVGLTVRDEHT